MAKIIRGKNRKKPYTVRYWTSDGRQRERSFITSAEARDFKIKVEHDARANIFFEPDTKTTLGAYADTWLAQHAVSVGSRRVYKSIFDNRIRPVLGDKPLAKITRDDVRTLLLETMPGEVGQAAVRTARTLPVAMLGEATRSEKIATNPAARIRLPSTESERAQFIVPTRQQIDVIVSHLPEPWALTVWIMRGTGLRIGEALAIREDSVREDTLRTEEQVLWTGDRGPLKHRKPGQYRDVPLPRYVADKIAAHVDRFGIPPGGYLFPSFTTGQTRPDAFRSAFRRAAASAGLPVGFSPHSLRHVYASVALANGLPVSDVSRFMGHASINTTFAIYGHLVGSAASRAAAVLDTEYDHWSAA